MHVVWQLPCCDVCSVLCVGASTDIGNKYGETQLHVAQLADESDPETKQRYEKVHEDTHTITHFDTAKGC